MFDQNVGRRFTARALLIAAALGTMCYAYGPVAHAASTPAASVEPTNMLTEIVVTATKFREPLQSIPIADTAIRGTALDKFGITDIKSMAGLAPNLDIAKTSSDNDAFNVTLRGVGSGNLTGTGAPGVATYIDGVYLGTSSALISDLIDIKRVEILRGPQGTLYGRNAIGGAINILTNKPDATPSFSASATYGNYDEQRIRGIANFPLSRHLWSRLTVFTDRHNGYVRNLYPGGANPDDKDAQGVRLQLLWHFDGGDQLLLRGYAQRIGGVGPGTRRLGTDTGTADGWPTMQMVGIVPGFPFPIDAVQANVYHYSSAGSPGSAPPVSSNLMTVDENARQHLNQHMRGIEITGTFKLTSWAQLKSITAYEINAFNILVDSDGSALPIESLNRILDARQLTQEFDLSSTGTGPWKWILGAFYYHNIGLETLRAYQPPGILNGNTPLIFAPPIPPSARTGVSIYGDGYRQRANTGEYSLSRALFADSTYHITRKLALTAGYRYNWDSMKVFHGLLGFQDLTNGWWNNGTRSPNPPDHANISYGDWGGRFAVDYAVTPSHYLYASWSRGYEAGGLDFNFNGNGQQIPYKPEHLTDFEVGSKNEMFHHTLRLNLDAFYYLYNNLQVFELTSAGPRTYNATNARVKGVEAELAWLTPIRGLQLDGSYGFLDARYNKFIVTIPTIQNFTGHYLNYSPRQTAHVGVQYSFAMLAGSVTTRADYFYKSTYFMNPGNTVYDRQGGFGLWNLYARWTSGSGRYWLSVYGRNLANKEYVASELIGPPFACGCRNINVGDPRTYGVTVGVKY